MGCCRLYALHDGGASFWRTIMKAARKEPCTRCRTRSIIKECKGETVHNRVREESRSDAFVQRRLTYMRSWAFLTSQPEEKENRRLGQLPLLPLPERYSKRGLWMIHWVSSGLVERETAIGSRLSVTQHRVSRAADGHVTETIEFTEQTRCIQTNQIPVVVCRFKL
ncbi:hypothetical protein N656DRAFT_497952 [Canariomyces notabilis]|uniref:Uncharacterized protein n=1 Tax=Canariomyces notabilis TaxID=2074819 RepID=A0AAN6TIY2_9PEZI|nr:hypothetical protein N656DRAFT_497952 [Canariomyces arenarius]